MKKKNISLIFLIISILINLFLPKYILAENIITTNELKIQEKTEDSEIKIEKKEDIFSDITAPNLLLAETNTEKIIYEKNVDEKIYPASITKLMTAILVIENCELDETVTVSENAVMSVPSGYVNANLQVGEELTVEDLLYVMLIPSANDAANALAEHVGGSIESFSTMMNTRAKELGCTGSNFTNPSGLHEKEHYTTCRDIYLISREAISKEYIKKIIGTTKYTLPKTNKYTGTSRIFTTTNYMIQESLSKYYYDYCIGGKTGYTGEAKNCVVEFVNKDGIELVAIVMGESAKVKGQKFLDTKEMFEYVFKNYESEQVAKENEEYETIEISNGTKETKMLKVLYKDTVSILKTKEDNTQIEKNIEYTNINAPIQKGDIIGNIIYQYDGIEYKTELIASENVEESKTLEIMFKILLVAVIIYIIYSLKKSKRNYGNHGKKYKNSKKRR